MQSTVASPVEERKTQLFKTKSKGGRFPKVISPLFIEENHVINC